MTSIWATLNETLDPTGAFNLLERTLDGFVSVVDEFAEVVIILAVVAGVVYAVNGGIKKMLDLLHTKRM